MKQGLENIFTEDEKRHLSDFVEKTNEANSRGIIEFVNANKSYGSFSASFSREGKEISSNLVSKDDMFRALVSTRLFMMKREILCFEKIIKILEKLTDMSDYLDIYTNSRKQNESLNEYLDWNSPLKITLNAKGKIVGHSSCATKWGGVPDNTYLTYRECWDVYLYGWHLHVDDKETNKIKGASKRDIAKYFMGDEICENEFRMTLTEIACNILFSALIISENIRTIL